MQVTGIKTHIVQPNDALLDFLDQHIQQVANDSIIAITSKIVSLCEGRVVAKHQVPDKTQLVKQEADAYLADEHASLGFYLTIKNGRMVPSAGIDESNVDQCYVLYPAAVQRSAEQIWHHLQQRHPSKNLGVIITDSHVTPLRRGVTGTAMAWCGFKPTYDYTDQRDLYHQPFRVTQINTLDALAAAAVFVMGEGAETMPLAMITDAPRVIFVDRVPTAAEKALVTIPLEEDLFAPILGQVSWVWN